MPGKRKRDEEHEENEESEGHSHGSTIFVSNLPYTATSTDLKTLFSDVAPIKNAFVVLEKETKVSKGVGYVTFAMKEDAEQCVEKGTVEMNGRNLRIDWAGAKPKPGEEAPTKNPKQTRRITTTGSTTSNAHDPNAIRTVILTGLPEGIDSKVLWKKVRKQEGAESVEYPAKSPDGSEDSNKAYVLFTSSAQAQYAIDRLNAHIFKGSVLAATLKKRLEKKPNRSSRLIVRNLPWNTAESELRELFLPYGSVHSVEIPTERGGEERPGRAPKAKGFAFVWMLSKSDAEKAIEKLNGTSIKDRPIAVDWALSKEKWLDVKENIEEQADAEVVASDSEEEGSDMSEDEALGVHSTEDVSMHSAQSDEESEEPKKPELPPPEAGTTLFVRNVPWEATEDDLRQLFRLFGPLRYVRIVVDHESNRSKGTAFACYWKKEDADKAIAISESISKETGSTPSAKNPFSAPSILVPDPSSSLARNLVLHGRTLDVVRAVTRETAGKLKDAGEKSREKADKRNLYLMREGVIFPNSPAASTIPSTELEKRINAYNQRRAILRSNPSLYVSKTRLSMRQLPTFVSERILRKLALHAVHEFEKEVEEGERESLAEDEIEYDGRKKVVDSLVGGEVELPANTNEKEHKKKDSKSKRPTGRIKQAKIIRVSDRVDPLTGKGRSKGYGFLEMARHDDALRVLRWANNNPDVGGLLKEWWKEEVKNSHDLLKAKKDRNEEEEARMKRLKDVLAEGLDKPEKRRLVVEFSIENVLVVKKREGRDGHVSRPRERSEADEGAGGKSPRASHGRRNDKKPKSKSKLGDHEEHTRSAKKAKMEDVAPAEGELAARIGKRANPLGSIIGRKRRMKKGKP